MLCFNGVNDLSWAKTGVAVLTTLLSNVIERDCILRMVRCGEAAKWTRVNATKY